MFCCTHLKSHAIPRFNNNRLGNETVDFIQLKPTWNVPGIFCSTPKTQRLYFNFHSIIMTYMIPWNRRFVLYVFHDRQDVFVFISRKNVGNDMIGLLYHTLLKGKTTNNAKDRINKSVITVTWRFQFTILFTFST